MKVVDIYADGACSKNPGPGGWAVILTYNGHEKEMYGFDPYTTNNRMELLAILKALEELKGSCVVRIYTDSTYAYNAFTKRWINKWQANNWITYDKKPVANKDLWQRLNDLSKKHQLEWYKVKGHSDNEMNNRCDKLARNAIKERGIQKVERIDVGVKNPCNDQE